MAAKGLVDFVLLSKYEFCSVLWGGLKLEGSNFVSLWPRQWISFIIEGQYHFRPSPWYLLNLRWHSGCLTNFISTVSETFVSVEGLLNFVFIFYFHWVFTRLTRFAKNTFDLQLCASILGALCASILGARCVGRVSMKFPVFFNNEGFPNYRGLIWCSCGLGGGFFLKTLPLISFQLAVSVSSNLWGD